MQLQDKSGIRCDVCGAPRVHDFTYYSLDFRKVQVTNNYRPAIASIFREQIAKSLDVCETCWGGLAEAVKRNYKPSQVGITCDLSGRYLSGSYEFYHCNVIKVRVASSGQPHTCVACHTQNATDQRCSNCGGTAFVRIASTAVDNRFAELDVSQDQFAMMVNKSAELGKSDVWSSST